MLEFIIWGAIFFISSELIFYLIINYVNKRFQWLIINRDEKPKISTSNLEKFFHHGYDEELGWIRKPNTSHTENGKYGETKWNINSKSCRNNPNFENCESKISCFGDSFAFCRQVNDDETWEHYLSNMFQTNVKNFGVGNYGIDQALLRLKREYPEDKTHIVIMGIVPDTISRIMSIWKHYYEYGNTFGFKPRFKLENDSLSILNNPINNQSKFSHYEEFLEDIRKNDYFYINKFRKEIIRFPYSITIFKNTKRNFSIVFWVLVNEILKKIKKANAKTEWMPMSLIMKINLRWRIKLFEDISSTLLLKRIIEEYAHYVKKQGSIPAIVFIPQKDDILFIKNDYHFYRNFMKELDAIDGLIHINATDHFLKIKNLDELYSDDNEYGGHLSREGNKELASIIYPELDRIID